MKPSARKKKSRESGDDLWAWAARRETPSVREDPPVQPGWYRGFLKKLSPQKDGS